MDVSHRMETFSVHLLFVSSRFYDMHLLDSVPLLRALSPNPHRLGRRTGMRQRFATFHFTKIETYPEILG